ncbi:unnamed protein product [Phaeothamnion confervicola]
MPRRHRRLDKSPFVRYIDLHDEGSGPSAFPQLYTTIARAAKAVTAVVVCADPTAPSLSERPESRSFCCVDVPAVPTRHDNMAPSSCNGAIVKDAEVGEVVQLSGDQRTNINEFLIDQQICAAGQIVLHGF